MELFKPVYTIPFFLASVIEKGQTVPTVESQDVSTLRAESPDKTFTLSWARLHPEPVHYEDEHRFTVLFGSPIIDDKIDKTGTLESICDQNQLDETLVAKLNGEFLILNFDKASACLTAVNDRFTSLPFFYHHDEQSGNFYGSCHFTDIWRLMDKLGKKKIHQEAFFEFLWLQRILGTKTYLEDVFYLEDASIMKVEGKKLEKRHYWTRSYQKSGKSFNTHAHQMAELVKQSVRRKTSDGKRYGLFLSGGMDSRTTLAAFRDNFPLCFTATLSENREQRTARQIAETKGSRHVSLQLDPDHYGNILDTSVHVAGGMYALDHGIFFGFNEAVSKRVDVCFTGHGFDYMFQGMYIPGYSWKMGAHTLYMRSIIDLPDDIATYFIQNASYRSKKCDVWGTIRNDRQNALKEFQRQSVGEILTRGKELTPNLNDLFEYMTFHHLSRHYSYPNHASIATFVEQRVFTFDNDIFDFYLSLPREHRFNAAIQKKCLKILDPALAKIWSANTDLPVTASCFRQTVYQLASAVKRRFLREEDKPAWTERTWPLREHAARHQPKLRQATLELATSGVLETLDFLDTEKLSRIIPRWLEGEEFPELSGDFIFALVTAGTFLKM